jgi:hypothetical protein
LKNGTQKWIKGIAWKEIQLMKGISKRTSFSGKIKRTLPFSGVQKVVYGLTKIIKKLTDIFFNKYHKKTKKF